ncbi:MAG: DUF3015 domain-containing protein [Spirochaetes bacterium]|nr:DUF3015 domain-containing protein [Spirochaetota bacterium]
MKKLIAVVAIIAFVGAFTAAFANQSNTGCGLGSVIFQGRNGLISQTLAATTNQSTYTQYLGITTGTSNCQRFSSLVYNERLNQFVAENLDSLAIDVARGSGEYLNTLAVLMDVRENDRAAFYSKLQRNFSRIFTSPNVTHDEVIRNIESVIRSS